MTTQTSRLVIEIDSRNALRNAQALGRELEGIDRNGQFASKSMDGVSVATRQLAGYMAGLVTVGAAVAKMDAYTGMQNRLKLVTESQEQLNLAMSDTFSIAQKSYQSWDSVIQVYQRFSDNAKTLKIDMSKTAELTETVSKAVAISGASTQAAEAALTQFGQALASGTLRGEELNSILEQTPALAKAIAQGMGITVGQLRSVAAEGKITGEVLADALTKSKKSVDELFAKTDITIGQSIQLLSNEVTKFTGEAGEASGAATTLASGIQVLANNLDAIAGIAMVGGAALLTKTILTQTVAVYDAIKASIQRRAADTAALQSQVQLAAVEVQRTRQVAALALTEINLARQELNSATTRQARAAATMRLTQAEVAYNIATKQSTAAVVTQTAAENALNASRSRGAMLLGLVGGPIGAITIGVAALTAGYMYLQKRTAEANAKLEEQGRVAEKTKDELLALKGIQLDVAKDDLAASFEDQNNNLNKLNLSFNGFIRTVKNANAGNKEVREISDQVHKGLMSQADAIERLNKLKLLTPEQKSQGLDLIKSYEEARVKAQQNADAQKTLGQQVTLSGNAASNAVGKVNDNTNAMYNNADAANAAADAQSKYISNLQKGAAQTIMTNKLIAKGWEIERAKMASQAAFENGGKVSAKDIQIIDMNIAANKKLQASEDAIANAKRGSSKASRAALSQQKKDAKEADRLAENQAKSRIDIDYRYLDEFKKFRADYLREVEEINKANFGSETSSMLKKAEEKYLFEEEMYLRQVTEEINAHKWSENQKLEYFYETQRIIVSESGKYNDEIKSLKLNALKEQEAHELGLIKLAKEQRIFQAEQAMYSEMDAIRKRYELEREEIAKTAGISSDEKVRRLSASQFNQKQDESDLTKSLMRDYMGVMGFEENPLIQQFEVLQKARENDLINEEEYQNAKLQLQAKSTASYMEGMVGGFAELVDENSKTYAVLFAAQKAFAVAQAMLNIPQAYSKAYDAVVGTPYIGPYIAPAIGAAAAALQVAQAASIKNVSMGSYATGGFTGIGGKFDPAGIVHKGEVVWSQEDIKRWGGVNVVEAMRTSQPPKGYSDGGLVTPEDTYRVGMGTVDAIERGANVQAERQAQANVRAQAASPQKIMNNLRVIMVKDEEEAKDMLYSADGEKAFLYHMKRNRSKV
ncbi:tape measure protein [Acinetobacter sp. ANC 7200]|uniref:tape measure protein n=1 Tax=Acinetobacter amyesii TaxID=2942470 RepID=UPI0020BFBC8B|nr:tape measure protein [Acinetobacter amyesii]MCL6243266.1 tape measure protein [Acinetobacter amyesii]